MRVVSGGSVRASEAGREKIPNAEILFVDDDTPVVDLVSQALGRLGCTVDAASSVEESLRMIEEKTYDVTQEGPLTLH